MQQSKKKHSLPFHKGKNSRRLMRKQIVPKKFLDHWNIRSQHHLCSIMTSLVVRWKKNIQAFERMQVLSTWTHMETQLISVWHKCTEFLTHSAPQNQFSIKDKQRIPTVKSLRGTICFYVNYGGYVTNVNWTHMVLWYPGNALAEPAIVVC